MGLPIRPTDALGWVRTSEPRGDEVVRYAPGHTFSLLSPIGLIDGSASRSNDGRGFCLPARRHL